MNDFRGEVTSAILGLLGIGAPTLLINHVTQNTCPYLVFACVALASVVSYGFGSWSMQKAYRDAYQEEPTELQDEHS